MAFPQVLASSISGPTAADFALTLPAGVTVGDLLVVNAAYDGDGTQIVAVGSGWTRAANITSSTALTAAVFWKIADGNDALTLDLQGNSAGETGVAVCYRITGHAATGPVECAQTEAYIVDGTVTATPNPPSLSPSWGAADTLWIAAASWDNASRTLSSYPSGYTANQALANGGVASANVAAAMATRELNAATEDPGVFTISAGDQWAAFTIAIKPASSGGGSGVSTTVAATTSPAVASITGSAGSAGVSTTISATTSPAQAALTGVAGSASGNIRLSLGMQRERGGYAASLSSLKWCVFNADHTAVIASGTALTTDANGNAVIDVNDTSYAPGDYVPVLVTDYNAATAAQDRVVRTFFGFVPAQAQP